MKAHDISDLQPGAVPRNGNGLSSWPLWMRFVAYVGLPGALAAYLVYALVVPLRDLPQKLDMHEAAAVRRDDENQRAVELMTSVLRGICLNTAKTDDDRRRCVEGR